MRPTQRTVIPLLIAAALCRGGYLSSEARAGAPVESAVAAPVESVAAAPPTNAGFPVFQMPMPALASDRGYLGLVGDGMFQIDQIKAQVLIIEVFNFYCPHCQRAAPVVNQVYRDMNDDRKLSGKIRMIGIGAGNSEYEVNAFKSKYDVPFPLLPDPDFKITRLLGIEFTPTFIGVKLAARPGPEQFYFKHGEFQDSKQFLAEMLKLSELE